MTAAPAIDVSDLRKVYPGKRPVTAVDGLDLRIERGEVFGLLGPNGAGKTTTVEICEGLLAPTSGRVEVLGRTWDGDAYALRQLIGVSLQETRFLDKQTVAETIDLFCSFYGGARPPAEVIGMVGLAEKAHSRVADLSGGQRQRLAVATALCGRPELLFLDEPTTGLDPQSRLSLWDVVRAFRDGGGTVLLTTHYMEEAAALCDRVMIVDHGRSIALGSPSELTASLGADHLVELEADALGARLDGAAIAALPSCVAHRFGGDTLTLTTDSPHRLLPALLRACDGRGIEPQRLATRHTSLEDVFVALTGRHLRDGEDG